MKFAAIDIGSNAVRLLVSNVYGVGESVPVVHPADLYRIPVRLGGDVFRMGRISSERAQHLLLALSAFSHILKVVEVEDYMACATSALRSAENGQSLVEWIDRETGIHIDIIDGVREAELIALNRLNDHYRDGHYLCMDVGGGSTELTLLGDSRSVASRSFDIGTLRLKEGLVTGDVWREMQTWIENTCHAIHGLRGIGSGGNMNELFRMTRQNQDVPLSRNTLERLHNSLVALTQEERMIQLGLKPDRADVIVPAGEIFLNVTKWAGIEEIIVPRVGLADGMIYELYYRWSERNP